MADKKPGKGSGNMAVWGLLFVLALALGGGLIFYIRSADKGEGVTQEIAAESTTTTDRVAVGGEKRGAVVDLNNTDAKSDQGREMQRRKEELGVKKSLDAVVQEKEQVKIGDRTVPMSKIIDQIKAKENGDGTAAVEESSRIGEEDLGTKKKPRGAEVGSATVTGSVSTASTGATTLGTDRQAQSADSGKAVQGRIKNIEMTKLEASETEEPAKYGIHLVLPGENLWKVHLDFLREYFAKKGITLERGADRPDQGGRSSGVARILKYAERMVHIYSLKDNELSDNLDLIKPNEKIVIFNITRLDKILRELNAEEIKKVHLEGDNLTLE